MTPAPHRLDHIAAASASRFEILGGEPLDERTWRDLDLDHVFVAIDRTVSTLGQQALYHRLRTAPSGAHPAVFEALVARMSTDPRARERAQTALRRLQDPHGYNVWWLARPDSIETRRWYAVFPVMTAIALMMAVSTVLWHGLLPALFVVLGLDAAVRIALVHRTATVAAALRQVAPIVETGQALSFMQDEAIAPLVGALAVDIRPLRRLKTIARWLGGDPFMLSFSGSGPRRLLSDVVQALYEYVDLVLLLDLNGVHFAAHDLRAHGAALARVTAAIGEIDAALGVASWRHERGGWTRPVLVDKGAAMMRDLRHPLLTHAVPNSLALEAGEGLLITGSNMSGKSTFIRTVGVNAVLAQTINTCLASAYEAPVLRVRSCIGREDSLQKGKSYYIVEVEAMLALVAAGASSDPHLFLCDELFRGTNAVERIAAAEAVLIELLSANDHRRTHVVLAATHDAELVDLLGERYRSAHFADRLEPDGLVFEYLLRPGPATTRNAIALLEIHGAPSSLVERALARAAALDRQRMRPA